MSAPRLFGLGTATLDFRITTADLGADYRAKLLARETLVLGGGAIANSLHQAAILGTSTQWLGRLGKDSVGRRIMSDLTDCRVAADLVVLDDEGISPFNVAVYAGENRRRVGGFLLPNCLAEIAEADIDYWCQAFRAGDWCLVEIGEIPLPRVLAFCRRIRDLEVRVVLDVDLDPILQCKGGSPELVADLVGCCDILLPNYEAMQSLYPNLGPEEMTGGIHQDYGCSVALTAGPAGCFYTDRGSVTRRKPPDVEVVDTVGAGDAFHGGFVWALMNGAGLSEAVDTGNACGAANCRVFGAREGMLDADALEAFRRKEG